MPKFRVNAFTIIELLVSILIVTTLGAIAFPAFSNVQEKATATKCLAGLRQAGAGLILDMADNNLETPEVETTITYCCGSYTLPLNRGALFFSAVDGCSKAPLNPLFKYDPENEPKTLSYGMLDKLVFKDLPQHEQWYLACSDNSSIKSFNEIAFDRHSRGVSVFFANGSARILDRAEIPFPQN